jgi:O-antigen/teichoic acid export membrane protein
VSFAVGTGLLAPYLVLWLFGETYTPTTSVLIILSAILLTRSIISPVAAVLVAVGWQSRRVVVQAIAAALNISLNLLVIQHFGIVGVAFVYVITEWVLLGGHLLLLWRAVQTGNFKSQVIAS